MFEGKNLYKSTNQHNKDKVPVAALVKNNEYLIEKSDKILASGKYDEIHKFLREWGINMLEPSWGEPVLRRLCKMSKIQATILVLAVAVLSLLPIIPAAIEGVFVNEKLSLDMLHDYQYFIMFPVGLPILLVVIICYFGTLTSIIVELCLSNVVSIYREELNTFVENAHTTFGNKFVVYAPYIIGSVAALIQLRVIVLNPINSWYSPNGHQWGTVAGWLSVLPIFPFYFLIALAVFRLGATYVVLSRLFSFPTNVQPLHPDGNGGLYPLGRLCIRLNLGVFYFGVVSVFGIMNNVNNFNLPLFGLSNTLIMVSYTIGAIVAFFLPLYSTHNRMLEAKKRILRVINDRHELINGKLHDLIAQGEPMDFELVKEIKALRETYSISKSMPVYPFNIKIVSSFITSFLGPIFLSGVTLYLPPVLDWLRNPNR